MRRPTLLISTMSVLLITLLMSLIIVPGTYSQGLDPTPELEGETAQDYFDRGLIFSNTVFDTAAALADFSKAIELDPTLIDAYLERGAIYHTVHAYNLARDDYQSVLDLNPDSEAALLGRARYHAVIARRENFEQAQADIDRVLELNPDSLDAIIAQGDLYEGQDLFDEAYEQFGTVLSQDAEHVTARRRRIEISILMSVTPPTLTTDLQTFVQMREGTPEQYGWQAFQLFSQGQLSQLTATCNEGLERFPNDALLLNGCIGVASALANDPELALEYADRAVNLVPISPLFRVSRGNLLRNAARADDAIADFEMALEVQPAYLPAIQGLLGMYLFSPLYQDCELAATYMEMAQTAFPETVFQENNLNELNFNFTSRCGGDSEQAYITVDNPTFDAGTTVVVPGSVMYPLGNEPGNLQGGPLCTSATEATVLQNVRLDTGEGPVWVEIECDGGTGWVPETLFD